jgi:hypothetical protein
MSGSETGEPIERETCAGCGEDTAIGSVFYSDRRGVDLKPGTQAFLCALCDQRIASSRRGRRLTDDELRNAIQMGSITMIAAWPAGNYPPGG